MMQQYFEVKRGLPPGTLLLFRLGDFFEMFYEDATAGSRLLGLTLTRRQDAPMAGIPYHAVDNYVNKLLTAGRKVAICDQQEPAQPGRLVKRSLIRILSPGTTLAPNQLDATRNHYLCALFPHKGVLRAAWLDLTTGEFKIAADPHPENLLPVLTALDPREVLVPEGSPEIWRTAPHEQTALRALHAFCANRACTELPAYHFDPVAGARTVMEALGVLNLEGFGLSHTHGGLGPAGALVYYATENLCARPENLRQLQEYRSTRTLLVDPATLRNLEIFQSTRGTRDGSLLGAINRTVTAPGARLLERWLASPTLDLVEIRRRQQTVGELLVQPIRLAELHDLLRNVRDIPRILGRLQNRLRNPRELGGIKDSLAQLPAIAGCLEAFGSRLVAVPEAPGHSSAFIGTVRSRIQDLPALRDLLNRALADELPADLLEGGYIRGGYDAEVDHLRGLTRDSKTWLSDLVIPLFQPG
jgi:DNA mismatch repair protein MutS